MFKIWFQNRFLPDGKPFYLFLILKLNLSKALQIIYLIFCHRNFYRENEQVKTRSCQTNYQSIICNGKIPNFKSFRRFGKNLQKSSSNPQNFAYHTKESRLLLQIIEPDHISASGEISIKKIFQNDKYFMSNEILKTRKFYEFILVDTESVQISHVRNPKVMTLHIKNEKF